MFGWVPALWHDASVDEELKALDLPYQTIRVAQANNLLSRIPERDERYAEAIARLKKIVSDSWSER